MAHAKINESENTNNILYKCSKLITVLRSVICYDLSKLKTRTYAFIELAWKTLPIPKTHIKLFCACASTIVIICSFAQHGYVFWSEQAKERMTVQKEFNTFSESMEMRLDFLTKSLSSDAVPPRPFTMFNGARVRFETQQGQYVPPMSFESNNIVFRKKMMGKNRSVLISVPIQVLSVHLGTSLDAQDHPMKGKIQTAAGPLFYVQKTPSLLESFMGSVLPKLALGLVLLWSGIVGIFVFQSVSVWRVRKYKEEEGAKQQARIQILEAERDALAKEKQTLVQINVQNTLCERALKNLQRNEQSRLESGLEKICAISTLLKHTLVKKLHDTHLVSLANELEKETKIQQKQYFEVKTYSSVDVKKILKNVNDILTPVLKMRSIAWSLDAPQDTFNLVTDSHLFEMLVMSVAKDLVSRSLDGSTLQIQLHPENRSLIMSVKGELVSQSSSVLCRKITIGSFSLSRTCLEDLAHAVGVSLSMKNDEAEISFDTQSNLERHTHDNVIPLFA